MSKSAGNYVGVTDPPEEMFGKLMSVPDEVVGQYYRLLLGADPPDAAPVEAKRELARRLVDHFHTEGAGEAAEAAFNRIHVDHEIPEDLPEFNLDSAAEVHLPQLIAAAFDVSSCEARRLLSQGGVKVDGEALPAEPLDVSTDTLAGKVMQVGKRRFVRLTQT
jgi:tyrosyl-tRNA synthetase